jgi:hypothetical protein
MELVTATSAVFLAVAGTLLHYVFSCMRRHCRHGGGPEHRHGTPH